MTLKEAATSLVKYLNGPWRYVVGLRDTDQTLVVYTREDEDDRKYVPSEWEGFPIKVLHMGQITLL